MATGIGIPSAVASLLGVAVCVSAVGGAGVASAQAVYDLRADWGNSSSNPNGVWAYRADSAALPAVAAWEWSLGSFTTSQPGWARSETSNDRIPFWFKASAEPTFAHDWLAGDVIVHTRDDANGVGTGEANVAWTSPITGTIDVSGSVWIGRDIGRSNEWSVWLNSTQLTSGSVSSGDPYSRANPLALGAGSGGASVLNDVPVAPGDVLMLRIVRTSQYGDFVGVNLRILATGASAVPTLGPIGALALAALLLAAALARSALPHPPRGRRSPDPPWLSATRR
jgi:hypothetical protein